MFHSARTADSIQEILPIGGQMGTPEEQDGVCQTYNVNFPVYTEVNVNAPTSGAPNQDSEDPLFTWLKAESHSKADVQWIFEKFLIAREGTLIRRYLNSDNAGTNRRRFEDALAAE